MEKQPKKNGRIVDENVALDTESVKGFFDRRIQKKLPYLCNYVNYQDAHPEVAVKRDRFEKERILPLLSLRPGIRVLDIGCGVARWAEALLPFVSENGVYVGVDFSEEILSLAKEHFHQEKNCHFFCAAFQDLLDKLPPALLEKKFQLILINGVFMYINDQDISVCCRNVHKLLDADGMIYLKESVGIHHRLTLDKIYSEELGSQYSAIYRSIEEYNEIVKNDFLDRGYQQLYAEELWKDQLKVRKETTAYFWLLKKQG